MATVDEIGEIYGNSFRLSQSLADAIRKLETEIELPRRRQLVTSLKLAQGELQAAQQYIQSVVQALDEEAAALQSKRITTNRSGSPPLQAETSIFTFRHATKQLVANAVVSASGVSVKLVPDLTFENVHPLLKEEAFLKNPVGLQPYLITLFAQQDCSVFVEANSEEGTPTTKQGFTVASLIGVATKLLEEFDRGDVKKAVIIPKKSKYEEVTKLSCLLPSRIQVVNLLGTVPRPQSINDAQPRLILCPLSEILSRTVVAADCAHLVWDDYDGSDMLIDYGFSGLRDVVYRAPARLTHATLIPKSSLFRCRVWSYPRTVNMFDVQPFSLAREVEGLFNSLPAGKNILFTTQTNAYITGVTIVASLTDVPIDADHLVIAEVPVAEELVRAIIREAFAKIVTFICQPTTPKSVIHAALQAEGLEERLTPLPSEARSEPSPSVGAAVMRY